MLVQVTPDNHSYFTQNTQYSAAAFFKWIKLHMPQEARAMTPGQCRVARAWLSGMGLRPTDRLVHTQHWEVLNMTNVFRQRFEIEKQQERKR